MMDLEKYAGNTEFPVIDAGTYECVVSATVKTTKDGTTSYLNIGYKVRDDVDQKFKGSYVFEKLFKDKTNPEWYDLTKSGSILITQKDKPGYKTTFDEVDEFVQYINGICLKVTVEKTYDDYSSKEINTIKYLSYKPTALGPYVDPKKTKEAATPNTTDTSKVIQSGEPTARNVDKLDIPSDDLPF